MPSPAAIARHHALQELAQFTLSRVQSRQEALARLTAHQAATAPPRPEGMPARPIQGDDAEYLTAYIETLQGIANRLRVTPGFVLED